MELTYIPSPEESAAMEVAQQFAACLRASMRIPDSEQRDPERFAKACAALESHYWRHMEPMILHVCKIRAVYPGKYVVTASEDMK